MDRRQIPNIITGLRILLVTPIVASLALHQHTWALGLFVLAGFSDGLDGFLARRYDWRTRLGGIMDPLADKILMTGCYVTLGWLGELPLWLVGLVIGRDLVILAGAFAYKKVTGRLEMEPLWISRVNTAAQLGLVALSMLTQALEREWQTALALTIALVTTTTLWSGGAYVWEWSRRAWTAAKGSAG